MENVKIKRVLIVILIIILAAFIAFFANTFRKFLIIKDLKEKVAQYMDLPNFYRKDTYRGNEGSDEITSINEFFVKDGKLLAKMTKYDKEIGTQTMDVYIINGKANMYIKGSDKNLANLNCEYNLIITGIGRRFLL